MTGFIRGLFGAKKTADVNNSQSTPSRSVTPERASDAFFLEADDAKSLGDVNYMRSRKTIRRTFPKSAGGDAMERVVQVSAMDTANGQAATPTTSSESLSGQPSEATQQRRQADSSMDTFRNMARNMKRS